MFYKYSEDSNGRKHKSLYLTFGGKLYAKNI